MECLKSLTIIIIIIIIFFFAFINERFGIVVVTVHAVSFPIATILNESLISVSFTSFVCLTLTIGAPTVAGGQRSELRPVPSGKFNLEIIKLSSLIYGIALFENETHVVIIKFIT